MKRPPAAVVVGPVTFSVCCDEDTLMRMEHATGSSLFGATDVGSQSIVLNINVGPDVLAETLLHEVLHACLSVAGISHELDDDAEERIVRALSPVLLQVVRSNPSTIRFLAAKHP
jgi:hypothetical protein